jgi:hypothetical protein
MAEQLQADWAELPFEVLQLIFSHVDDLQLLTSVAATCQAWRHAIHVSHRNTIDFSTLIDPYCVEDEDIHLVASLFGPTLQSINLSGCHSLTSASFECLQQRFPSLQTARLNGHSVYYLSQCALASMGGLQELEMQDADLQYRGRMFSSQA